MGYLHFTKDIQRGRVGEDIFKTDFLEFLDIDYVDVTGCQAFQVIDSDFKTKIGMYEVKANYKDNDVIIIEEYTNCNQEYGNITYGWWHKTKADLLVFISKETRTMILVPMNDDVKRHYEAIKNKYQLRRNRPTTHKGNIWQSAFRMIPLADMKGYYSKYKKI